MIIFNISYESLKTESDLLRRRTTGSFLNSQRMYELALAYLHARNHERPYEQRNSAAVSQPILTQLIFTLNLLLIILRPPLSD